ncbi:MAG: leucyl aminopeptidase [Rhodobacteraceae bacterium]|nr:leucyl aminopeptidase [Paracoccaceae bacterium]MCY4196733.1 leucyl aminopeptidase [Paracoccaceae bacterium]
MAFTAPIRFKKLTIEGTLQHTGIIALCANADGVLLPSAMAIDKAVHGAVTRAASSEAFMKLRAGESMELKFPSGLNARSLLLLKLDRNAKVKEAHKAGGQIARLAQNNDILVLARGIRRIFDIAFGAELASYRFSSHKTGKSETNERKTITIAVTDSEAARRSYQPQKALAAGVCLARTLVDEPANVLTTGEFAARLRQLTQDGVDVEILEESDLQSLGMRALLAVGQGSASPSRVAILKWLKGDGDPLVLAGKGVVFDTGGISLKPAAKMEQMTMDMAGAATVAGVMKAVACRKAAANVIGIVGLVENMPGGTAQRPGDVVRSLKGDTVEVINTDAEGRLVLADLLWYAQQEFSPGGIIDLATLTGAIIVSLGTEFAGLFSNSESFSKEFMTAAVEAGERAWRMPLDDAYDKMLKSRIADMKNVGGRDAGAITAAQFLQRFVKPSTDWIHLDIAGVASRSASDLAPTGATGWGVRTIDRLIQRKFEIS